MKSLLKFITSLFKAKGADNTEQKSSVNLTKEERQLLAYIKISRIIDREVYSLYNSGEYLFIVLNDKDVVVLAFNVDRIILNKELEESEFVVQVIDTLSKEFDLITVKDSFAIDSDNKAIYIGKAAVDYLSDMSIVPDNRVLH